jgi:hypothetical protein
MTGLRRHDSFAVLVLFFTILGISLHNVWGMFAWKEVGFVSVAWLCVTVVSFSKRSLSSSEHWDVSTVYRAVLAILLFFSALLVMEPGVPHRVGPDASTVSFLVWMAFVCAAIIFAISWLKPLDRRIVWQAKLGFFVLGMILFLTKIFAIRAVPNPFIDVFTSNSAAADYLLRHLNPYSQKYADIYRGIYDYPPGFVYWPGVLLWQTASKLLFGDIRYGYLFADLLTILALNRILKKLGWDELLQWAVPILWLSFPVTYFILQQSWVDTLLICSASLFVLLLLGRRFVWAGAVLGYFCGIKQYSVFFGLFAVAFVLLEPRSDASEGASFRDPKSWNWREFTSLTGSAVIVFALLVGSFAAWDWQGFYFNTIYTPLTQKMRMDSLSLIAAAARLHVQIPGWVSALVYLGCIIASICWIARRTRHNQLQTFTAALVVTYGATFLFGKQAFCNYYYLLSFFVLLNVFARQAPVVPGSWPEPHQEGGLPDGVDRINRLGGSLPEEFRTL